MLHSTTELPCYLTTILATLGDIQYINEHLGPRHIGHFAMLLAFFGAILSMISYFMATRYRDEKLRSGKWQRLGQLSFLAHGAAVFTVIGCIFYAMLNQYYEYQYVSAHVSADLSQRYIFSAFWEGQEGSFLLWMSAGMSWSNWAPAPCFCCGKPSMRPSFSRPIMSPC